MTVRATQGEIKEIDAILANARIAQPSLVTEVPPNQGWFKVDSADRDGGSRTNVFTPANNFKIGKINDRFSASGISKIQVGYVNFPWFIPNVNPRNNCARFYQTDGTLVEVTMPEGFYNLDDFITELQNILTATGYGTWVVSKGKKSEGYKLSIRNTLTWVPDITPCEGQRQSLWELAGMYVGQYSYPDDLGTQFLNYFTGQYTRYVDIVSSELNSHEKILNDGTHGPANDLIIRIFSNPNHEYMTASDVGIGFAYTRPHLVQFQDQSGKWISWNPTRSFGSNIDFRVLDEYGDLVYMGEDAKDYPNWTISFITQ